MTTDYVAMREQLLALTRELGSEIPNVVGPFSQLHKAALASGALEPKVKELMAIAISITTHCEGCISFHVHDALKAGASRKEVLETVGLAVLMGGGPAMTFGCKALEALKQFASE